MKWGGGDEITVDGCILKLLSKMSYILDLGQNKKGCIGVCFQERLRPLDAGDLTLN